MAQMLNVSTWFVSC